jgi:hypothetical protein
VNFVSPDRAQALAGAEPILTIELAHVWRSRILDKCAEAERYVLQVLIAGGGACSAKAPLSKKMESLARLIADGCLAARADKIGGLLKKLEPLSDLRSELAHSTLSIADIEGETVAVLRHAGADTTRTILSLARLKGCHGDLSGIVNSLGQQASR